MPFLGIVVVGCGLFEAPRAPVEGVEVRPQAGASLQLGQSLRLKAIATLGHRPVPAVAATWVSSAPDVARVDADGVVSAVSPGDAIITAEVGGERGRTAVSVLPTVSDLRLIPDSATLSVGQRARILAVGTSGVLGTTLPQRGIISARVVGTSAVEVTALAVGSDTLRVFTSGARAVTVRIRVQAQIPQALMLSDPFIVLRAAASAQLGLATGVSPPPGGLLWTSSDARIATVTPSGRIDALSPGTAYVKVEPNSGSLRPDSALVIVLTPAPSSMSVTPRHSTVGIGGSDTLEATVRDQAGQLLNATVRWYSQSPATATVSRTGVVTGISPGRTIVLVSGEVANATPIVDSIGVTVARNVSTLTIHISGTGVGVVSTPQAGCFKPAAGEGVTTCTDVYETGSLVRLTAFTFTPGHAFTGWSGACSGQIPLTISSTIFECDVRMSQDRTVGASFTAP